MNQPTRAGLHRTKGRGDFGRWDARDDPDGDVTYPFALNNPPSRWNPKEQWYEPSTWPRSLQPGEAEAPRPDDKVGPLAAPSPRSTVATRDQLQEVVVADG